MTTPRAKFGELPEVLELVAEQAGLGSAAAFARAFGGRRIYTPKPHRLSEKHPWVTALAKQGLNLIEAKNLAEVVGPGVVDVPFGPFVRKSRAVEDAKRRSAVVASLRQGRTKSQVAKACELTERRVYQIQAEERSGEGGPDPLPLFPEPPGRT